MDNANLILSDREKNQDFQELKQKQDEVNLQYINEDLEEKKSVVSIKKKVLKFQNPGQLLENKNNILVDQKKFLSDRVNDFTNRDVLVVNPSLGKSNQLARQKYLEKNNQIVFPKLKLDNIIKDMWMQEVYNKKLNTEKNQVQMKVSKISFF